MTPIRTIRAAAVLLTTLALTTLAACSSAAPSQPPTSQSPTASGSAPAAAPAPSATSAAPAERVLSYEVTYPWHWPNDVAHPGNVQHSYQVPPMPELTAIAVGDHPGSPAEHRYNRMSFTFTTAFPSYQFSFVSALNADPSGRRIPLAGEGILKITFGQAQAHTADGTSSVLSKPPAALGLNRMVSWARAGDFEGVLSFGIGVHWPIAHSNPQLGVRAVEVEKVTPQGTHLYVVAFDIVAD
jgi:hypothetical protein